MATPPKVLDNKDLERYEIEADGAVAFLQYRHRTGTSILVHTEVPKALQGRGLANVLARHALDVARHTGQHVLVRCPFVASFIRRHPEYGDLVRSSPPGQPPGGGSSP